MIKTYAPWILLVATIIFFLRLDSCKNAKRNGEVAELKKEVSYWKDESGNAHAKLQESILSYKDLREEVDSIAKVLKIRPKQVVRYVSADLGVDTTVNGKIDTVYLAKDTIPCPPGGEVVVDRKQYLLEYSDSNYLKIKARVPSDPQEIEVGLNATITFTDYYKRKKVLGFIPIGKKVSYTDIGTDNPYIKISNAEAFRLMNKSKLKVRTGFGIGVAYDPWSKSIHPSIQAGIYLIRTK